MKVKNTISSYIDLHIFLNFLEVKLKFVQKVYKGLRRICIINAHECKRHESIASALDGVMYRLIAVTA